MMKVAIIDEMKTHTEFYTLHCVGNTGHTDVKENNILNMNPKLYHT